ncbi:slc44a2 [Symbiodinium natans]|uniref:Slc44a2 protein n=1 Tax=Symbiodinium natans TaxID=878477 RepID=A0A812R6W0_9DINO|nr:slc44a2 [Symbiodinium natans]
MAGSDQRPVSPDSGVQAQSAASRPLEHGLVHALQPVLRPGHGVAGSVSYDGTWVPDPGSLQGKLGFLVPDTVILEKGKPKRRYHIDAAGRIQVTRMKTSAELLRVLRDFVRKAIKPRESPSRQDSKDSKDSKVLAGSRSEGSLQAGAGCMSTSVGMAALDNRASSGGPLSVPIPQVEVAVLCYDDGLSRLMMLAEAVSQIRGASKLPRELTSQTPLDVQSRPPSGAGSCTDCCCLLTFAAVLGGLGFCIYTAYSQGDIQRLQSLPDYQGTQCVEKFVFFPQDEGGLNLQRQVCVDACPTAQGEQVTTYLVPERRLAGSLVAATELGQQGAGVAETDSLLFGSNEAPQVQQPQQTIDAGNLLAPTAAPTAAPAGTSAPLLAAPVAAAPAGTQEQTLVGYPTIPVAGVLCFPKIGSYEGQIVGLQGSNALFTAALEVNNLSQNVEVLLMAGVLALILAFVFLCLVEYFGLFLVRICVAVLVTAPAALGLYFLQLWYQDEMSPVGTQIASMSQGYINDAQGLLVAGTLGVGMSVIFGLVACCSCSSVLKATEAAQEAADCLMTMPSLLLEPMISLILKVPFFVGGVVLFLVLVTSGDFTSVDLTKPSSLFNPDDLALTCAVYEAFVFLWFMEVLHYISVFVVIYTAEVWYFKHYGTSRTNFCGACGPTVMLQAYIAAITKHLGSLIYAALLIVLLRVARWVVKAILSTQEILDTNPLTACISKALQYLTAACLGCVQRILDLTSQVALMDIAYHGDQGFCGALEHSLEVIFSDRSTWAAVEGICYVFVALGIAGIGAGTCVIMYVCPSDFARALAAQSSALWSQQPLVVPSPTKMITSTVTRYTERLLCWFAAPSCCHAL